MTLKKFELSNYLDDAQLMANLLNDALESGDDAHFYYVLGEVAKAKGLANIAEKTGVQRTSLYKSLSESGNPNFKTIHAVLISLGFNLKIA